MGIKRYWRLVVLLMLVMVSVAQAAQPDDIRDLVDGNTAFAFDLYHAVRDDSDNLIVSPYSISQALAMTYGGARGETAEQMAATLHFTLPQDGLHPAFAELDERLPGDDPEPSAYIANPFQLNIVNALWGALEYPFRPEYLDLLDTHYGAGLRPIDFAGAPEDARQTINAWVSDQTEGRIPDLIKPGMIVPQTRLVLTNAVYFKADWEFQFDPALTEDAPFTLLDGSTVTVPMMSIPTYNPVHAYQGDDFDALRLAYASREGIMLLLILPDSGQFDAVESRLDAALFDEIVAGLGSAEVKYALPRFEFDSDLDLKPPLVDMGMPLAFSADADLTGMASANEPLFISDVVHKAFIRMDESGTEAAAATAAMGFGGGPGEPIPKLDLRFDRPFMFAIYHQDTGAILFLGRVLNPPPADPPQEAFG